MRPNYSHYSRENATLSSGISPIACCKRDPPPGAFSMARWIKDKNVQMLNFYWKESTSLFQSGVMSRLVCWIFPINDIFLLSFHAMFITEFCFVRLPQMAVIKKYPASTHFQYSSAKFILFWFWLQPITMRETGIQKCLWLEQFIGI